MAELKTKASDASVAAFLAGVGDARMRADCETLVKLMREATKAPPRMWGPSIVGFGDYHYVYESGREGDWFMAGFSPRKRNLTLYIMAGFGRYEELLGKLGRHKTGKACLYLDGLDDVHLPTLKRLIQASVAHMRQVDKAAKAKSARAKPAKGKPAKAKAAKAGRAAAPRKRR